LTLILFIGLVFCIPQNIIDLRVQETLFPLVAAGLWISVTLFLRIDRMAGLFSAFMVLTCITRFTPYSYLVMTYMITYAAMYYATVVAYQKIRKEWIYNTVCVFAIVNMVWIVMQMNEWYLIFYMLKPEEFTGLFANRNETAIFMAAALPFFFRKTWWLWLIPFTVTFLSLQCTNGLIAAGIVISIYTGAWLWSKGRIRAVISGFLVLAILSVAFIAFVHTPAWKQRYRANIKGVQMIAEKPFFGWGMTQGQFIIPLFFAGELETPSLSAWQFKNVIYQNDFVSFFNRKHDTNYPSVGEIWTELHNDYLQLAIEGGLISLLFLIGLMLSHVRYFFRTAKRDNLIMLSLIAIAFTANAFFTFQIGRFVFLSVLMLGMIRGAYEWEQKE
jgi:hypothetical protein